MGRLDGRVAFLTGAGRGIGAATAAKLASEGASVAITDMDTGPAEETANEIRSRGGSAVAIAVDVTNRVQVGMVGVNFAIPVPLSYYTFGGWKRSGFGDLNQHGPDSIRFYTKTKTVTARWPSGTKEGAEFVIPTMR